jgi:uracil-DNA glycosylase family 4
VDKVAALEAVAQELASGKICPHLFSTAKHPVPGEGDPNASLMFIGEAPGAREDELGKPFVGPAGRFLDHMLSLIELTREQVFVTSVIKFRPPENRDPTPQEIADSLPILLRQIDIIKPKLIILLGRYAMNVFLPGLKISQVHGELVETGGQAYLALYHPAAALHNGSLRQTLIEDFQKIPTILNQLT